MKLKLIRDTDIEYIEMVNNLKRANELVTGGKDYIPSKEQIADAFIMKYSQDNLVSRLTTFDDGVKIEFIREQDII